jgi:hypothetical protein
VEKDYYAQRNSLTCSPQANYADRLPPLPGEVSDNYYYYYYYYSVALNLSLGVFVVVVVVVFLNVYITLPGSRIQQQGI